MPKVEVALKSAGPAGANYLRKQVTGRRGFFTVRWPNFMLSHPRPADQASDIRAAEAAVAESDERIPYERIRRELGLG